MIYRFNHSVYYANTELLSGQVTDLAAAASPPLEWFCIDAAAIDDIDFTGGAALRAVHNSLREAGVKLVFVHVSDEVQATLEKYEIAGLLDRNAFFGSLREVVDAYRRSRGD
jgi:MFS superfamily sulfate permease-like transporter